MTKADASQMAWVAPGTHHLLVQAAGEVTQHCARCLVATGGEPPMPLPPLPCGHSAEWVTHRHRAHPAALPGSNQACPEALGHKTDILQVPPLQSQRSLCCPCRVGWCSATFEHQGPAC